MATQRKYLTGAHLAEIVRRAADWGFGRHLVQTGPIRDRCRYEIVGAMAAYRGGRRCEADKRLILACADDMGVRSMPPSPDLGADDCPTWIIVDVPAAFWAGLPAAPQEPPRRRRAAV